MDIQKEREAFNKEFGINNADTFPAFSGGIESSAVLKCNWLGWKKRAELECRENPETIEIEGIKTIHKLCKFADEHNMEGCTFTEIVECMFDELAKAQAVPENKTEFDGEYIKYSNGYVIHCQFDEDFDCHIFDVYQDEDCIKDGMTQLKQAHLFVCSMMAAQEPANEN